MRRPWLLALPPLAVYLLTLARAPGWGDSTELALAASTLSIPHPTGYPFYLLLAHLATLVPAGDLPVRAGLMSAVPAALAVPAVFALARRVCGNELAAAAAALSFAFWREPWEQATVPEVYALHLLVAALALLALVRLLDEPSPRRLALAALALGVGFAHHLQTVFLVPGAALAALLEPRVRALVARPRVAGAAAAAALVPLSLYGVLLVRAQQQPLFDEGQVRTPGALVAHATGRQFRYRMFGVADRAALEREVARLAREVGGQPAPWWPLGVPLLALAALGVRRAAGSPSPHRALFGGAAATCLVYTLGYQIPDKSAYYLTAHMMVALLVACGLAEVLARAPRRAALAACALAVALPLAANFRRCDRAEESSLADYTADLARLMPPDALLVTDDVTLWWGFVYRQVVLGLDGQRAYVCTYPMRLRWYLPFLRAHAPGLAVPDGLELELEQRLAQIDAGGDSSGAKSQAAADALAGAVVEANLDRRPVALVIHQTAEQLDRWGPYHLQSLGLLYRVMRAPAPPVAYPADYASPERHRLDRAHGVDAQRVSRRYSTSLNRLGILHIQAGKYPEAERAFRRALEYEPGYPQVLTNLGVLYADKMGRPQDAYEVYREFLRLHPADKQAPAVQHWVVQYQRNLKRH